MALALVALTGQPARAAACGGTEIVSASGGLSLGQPGGLHVGNSYTTGVATITNTSTCDTGAGPVGENVTLLSHTDGISLVPACKDTNSPCVTPDGGVIMITSASSPVGTCGGNGSIITWAVSGGPGTFTLTSPADIALAPGAGSSDSCTIDFNYQVDSLPTADANSSNDTPLPNLDTGGSVRGTIQADSGTTAHGDGGTDTKFVFTCGVKVDKQISCDGGKTWNDAAGFESANGDGTNGCVGFAGVAGVAGTSGILTRFAAQNISDSGLTLGSCTIGDDNANLGGISTTFAIPNNGTVCTNGTFVSGCGNASTQDSGFSLTGEPTTPLECNAAGPGTDTATATCTCVSSDSGFSVALGNACTTNANCAGGQVCVSGTCKVQATDSADFACCGVEVDKQVSCNGGAFTDVGFETANGDTTNNCSAIDGQSVAIQYFIKNTGNLSLTCTGTGADGTTPLGLMDTFVSTAGTVLALTAEGPFASGASSGTACSTDADCTPTTPAGRCFMGHCGIVNTSVTMCSDTLNTNEATGNKAQIDCKCSGTSVNGPDVDVTAFDIAQIRCTSASFTTSKNCVATGTPGNFTSTVSVDNTGSTQLSCTVVDQTVTGPCGTLPTCPITGGAPVTVTGQPLVVAGTTSSSFPAASINGLASTSCNQACVTCTPSGGTALPAMAAEATCPVGTGCFARTPGFWKHHLDLTNAVLALNGGSVTSCGIILNNTNQLTNQSTIADLCTLPGTLPFQCAAAALNLVASGLGGLDCEGADPGITAAFNACCGAGGTCAQGGSQGTSAACDEIAAFNGMFETSNVPPNFLGGSEGANVTGPCRTDQQAGFLNTCTNSSTPPIPTCGTGRVNLVAKKAGK